MIGRDPVPYALHRVAAAFHYRLSGFKHAIARGDFRIARPKPDVVVVIGRPHFEPRPAARGS